ncbi:MAG: hypothetical protein QG549_385 [Patescibacteria group bacterium]|nr:hypothetical protein [Patescibacteria group bacterium]
MYSARLRHFFYVGLVIPFTVSLEEIYIIKIVMSKYLWYIARVALLTIVYLVCAELSEKTIVPGEAATLIWPSAGVGIAALYIFGYRLWPGIALGVLLHSTSDMRPFFPFAMCAALGATIAAVISVYLLKKTQFDRSLTRMRDVTKFVIYAGLLAPTISATIGVGGLVWGQIIGPEQFLYTWTTWWIGDALGILVYAPLLLVWDKTSLKKILTLRKGVFITAVSTLLLLAIMVAFVFGVLPLSPEGINPYKYAIMPLMPIIALYFGQRGNVTAMAIALTLAIIFTVIRYQPGQSYYLTLGILQQAVAVLSLSFMYVAAAIGERDAKKRALVRRAIELDEKRAYFQQLSDAKDEFISIASHQLRSPATGIKMHLGMLRTGILGNVSSEQQASIDAAYETNERLIMTIEDLLTTAELDAGGLALAREKVDIKELLQSVVDSLTTVVSGRDQTVEIYYGPGQYIRKIDRKKFSIAIENIIENASKYSHPKTTVHVGLARRGDRIIITVRDEGVGIVKKDIRKLFNKFARIPNELTTERGGNGLGLYLVKEIVESHGGRISVKSEPGVGTTFTISI